MLRVQQGIRLRPAVPFFVCLFCTYLKWSINLQPTLKFQFHFLTRLISLYLTLQIKTALASNPFGNMGFVFNSNIFLSPLLCMHLFKHQSVFFCQSALACLRPDPWPERLGAGKRCVNGKTTSQQTEVSCCCLQTSTVGANETGSQKPSNPVKPGDGTTLPVCVPLQLQRWRRVCH